MARKRKKKKKCGYVDEKTGRKCGNVQHGDYRFCFFHFMQMKKAMAEAKYLTPTISDRAADVRYRRRGEGD